MYTDTSNPNHLIAEVVDNSVDEALAGYAKQLKESGTIEAIYASRHLYGSGMSWHMYVVYPDWKSLAKWQENFEPLFNNFF